MPARRPEVRLSARQNARLRARLDALLKREGLSERALAKRSGLSIGAVRSVGGTEAGPTLGTLLALVRALKLASIDQLLGPSSTILLDRHDELDRVVGESAIDLLLLADMAHNGTDYGQRTARSSGDAG